MKSILINKEIGGSWFSEGITADSIRKQLEEYDTSDNKVQLVIDSPGGSVWECISIFNTIRNFMRQHKDVCVETYIQGMAASSASIIALAAKTENPDSKIICEDNSVYMIHNAWSVAIGNRIELEKQAALLKSIDNTMAKNYVQISGKPEDEIHQLMDDESYFFGQEIVDNGFADEVIKSDSSNNLDKNAALAMVKNNVVKAQKDVKLCEDAAYSDIAASLIKDVNMERHAPENKNAGNPVEKMEDVSMTLEELKAKEPALFAEVKALGVKEGTEAERSRCSAHLKMGETAGCLDVAAGFIRDGSAVADDTVQTTYFEKRVANAAVSDRQEDNPAETTTPAASSNEKEDVMMSAFDKALGGK